MKKIVFILTLAVFVSCNKKTESTAALKQKKASLEAELAEINNTLSKFDTIKQEALVSTLRVKDTVFNHYIDIQGNVDTNQNILIQPEMPGTLIQLNVKAGQYVSRGQVIGRVDDGGANQQVASLETQYQLAKTTFERQKNLWNQKIGSEIQYLQAQTQMISLSKAVAQAKAQLGKSIIKAPFSGVIDEVFVERGQVVSASPQGLMRIVNLSNMYVSAALPETYVGKLKVGTPVKVGLTALGKEYTGKVRQISGYINPSNRTFSIEVSVPNSDNLLRPNQVANLKVIDYASNNAIVLPTNVIQEDSNGNKFVFVVTNTQGSSGIAKKAIIKLGESSGNSTEVLSGIALDELVITDGANSISEGMKVNF